MADDNKKGPTSPDSAKVITLDEAKRREAKRGFMKEPAPLSDEDAEKLLDELAGLSDWHYAKRRADSAKRIGVSAADLDKELRRRRQGVEDGDDPIVTDVEPWPSTVDLHDVLGEISAAARRHLIAPDGASETLALWVVFAHCHDAFDISPLLAFTSATPSCGKTSALAIVKQLVPRALAASNITPAVLFRVVEKYKPTLLVDEADTFLRDNDELRGVINSGHNREGAFVLRVVGDDHDPKKFSTWGPKAIAMIGRLPPTLASRSVIVALKRKTVGDVVDSLRSTSPSFWLELQRKAAKWALDNTRRLSAAPDPVLPQTLLNRGADNWRPLVLIADAAGGAWPDRSRQIAERLGAEADDIAIVHALKDIADLFAGAGVDFLQTSAVLDSFHAMDTRPWGEWGRSQKPITGAQLARLLKPLGIIPVQGWVSGTSRRGYHLGAFREAFRAYIPSHPLSDPLGRYESQKTADYCDSQPLGDVAALAARNGKKPQKTAEPSGLAGKIPLESQIGEDGDPFAQFKTGDYLLADDGEAPE